MVQPKKQTMETPEWKPSYRLTLVAEYEGLADMQDAIDEVLEAARGYGAVTLAYTDLLATGRTMHVGKEEDVLS